MTSDDFEGALGKFRSDLAAETLRQAIRDLETKFDPNQPRVPVGTSDGGQWVDAGRGGDGAKVRKLSGTNPTRKVRRLVQAARVLARHPQAGPVAQAVGLPALAGGVAITRAFGDFDSRTTGREKTPFLKLPKEKLNLTGPEPLAMSRKPRRPGSLYPYHPYPDYGEPEECEEAVKPDYIKCQTFASMYGRNPAERREIQGICLKTIAQRYAECIAGGVGAIRTPLYQGRW